MTPAIERHATFLCHPSTATGAVNGIAARARVMRSGALAISYRLSAKTSWLRIASPRAPQRTDGLWQHTCFEAFIKASASSDYYEFNFSPSGEWAAYLFRSYRDGGRFDDDSIDPAISVNVEDDCLVLNAAIGLNRLPAIRSGARLLIGLSAVIEASDGSLSYWALKHPSDKPDFHHPDSFALELALPGERA